jgi:hypothetical protein
LRDYYYDGRNNENKNVDNSNIKILHHRNEILIEEISLLPTLCADTPFIKKFDKKCLPEKTLIL